MKIHHYVIVVLLTACIIMLGLNLKRPAQAQAPEEKPMVVTEATETKKAEGALNPTIEIIHQRKSVRQYTDRKVSREDLETLVRAAMAAPTAGNRQPWAFVVVTRRETLDQLAENLPHGKMLKSATAAISVVGLPQLSFDGTLQEYWIQDCSAATQNLLLAVESMGLGAVWIGVHPSKERIDAIRRILNIPGDGVPLNVISIGYPTGAEKPKDKYKPERIHWEQWEEQDQ